MGATGSFVMLEGDQYYKISGSEGMEPFLINVVSAGDVWIFVSSKGGITAGRQDASGAVFPYETDDRLHGQAHTGSKTVVRAGNTLWEPFEHTLLKKWQVTQNIYKSVRGTRVIFEEINHSLALSACYAYEASGEFGLVKTLTLKSLSDGPVELEVLDGLENLLPYGVNEQLQATSSTLTDAYKANELCPGSVLAVYSMTTLINDTPNPVEMLRANVAWTDKQDVQIALDSRAVAAFCRGEDYPYGADVYGRKGAYLVRYRAELPPRGTCSHRIVVDSGYDHGRIISLKNRLRDGLAPALEEDLRGEKERLYQMVSMADGVQNTGDETAAHHHYLNTLYNLMRGGALEDGYDISPEDFLQYLQAKSKSAAGDAAFAKRVKGCATIQQLKAAAGDDPQLLRLVLDYLPLSFSRRHGDPSRPWNRFHIRLRDENGKRIKSYEGNWRDIFQNWEALALSYPCYYESMVARFVNASTADGFNPYRLYRDGMDWEKPDPENPFSGLGYWGDHQIIYLLRLLMGLKNHFPQRLRELLHLHAFSYANVPYRLKPYGEILQDSKNTVAFDFALDKEIESRVQAMGTDGQLLLKDGKVYCVSLMEKLLVPLLSKMSSLHLGGGVWMNTQRPEWNDANNAIVGIGLSMVTAYHMKAYVAFLREAIPGGAAEYAISTEVADWLEKEAQTLSKGLLAGPGGEKKLLDDMGYLFSGYREKVYHTGFTGEKAVLPEEILKWLALCDRALDITIEKARGELYGTYNLLHPDGGVEPMRPMLEGQSAAIGSGIADAREVSRLLAAMDGVLKSEKLGAHYLYPREMTVPFLKKNRLETALAPDGHILCRDEEGTVHFAPAITSSGRLRQALEGSSYTKQEQEELYRLFEEAFRHGRFTGRSQVMYKYEGIGCIYWHQNAKLALAVLETAIRCRREGAGADMAYQAYKALAGQLLYRKSPEVCQAVPIEPYSHSSFDGLSQQPGMTGQVKESLLMRRGELGVLVEGGCLRFDPWFVDEKEWGGEGRLTFTVCGVPVFYKRGGSPQLRVQTAGGKETLVEGMVLPAEISLSVFSRDGSITGIEVSCGEAAT